MTVKATAWASSRAPGYAPAPVVAAAALSRCLRRRTRAWCRARHETRCPRARSRGRTWRHRRGRRGGGGGGARSPRRAHGRSSGPAGSGPGRRRDASYWGGGRRSRGAASSSPNNGGTPTRGCSADRVRRRTWARWRTRAARGPGVVAMATRAPPSSPSRGSVPTRSQPRGRACLCGRSSIAPWLRAAGRRVLG